ncbi:MAG: CBS domain-containing protein [Candidatus Altiarchaeales archaeon HGW-Altiarchaeales-3]|nr:MAG: CBS domain-containing protein [Candidatus Altiarchaeales archaeon HGW-Altiarchaeales-3]
MTTNKQGNVKQSKGRAPQNIKSNVRSEGESTTKTTKTRYIDMIKKPMEGGHPDFQKRASEKTGEIMEIAEKTVITAYPTTPVKDVAELMEKHDFRRIPITDPGTGRLEGMAVAIDILDFFGGGEKYNIIKDEYNKNFLAAINCPIRRIMFQNYSVLDKKASIDDCVDIILNKHHSAIPIIDGNANNKVIAIVTERDVLPKSGKLGHLVGEVMHRDIITSSKGMMISDVLKVMVRSRKRRLPVVENDRLVGIITVFDVLRFIGKSKFKGTDIEEILSERVENIMAKDIKSVSPKQDVADVLKLVDETGLGGFPVVENNELLGIVTVSDIIKVSYA